VVNHVPRGVPTVLVGGRQQMALRGLVMIALQEHYIFLFLIEQVEIKRGLIVVIICLYQTLVTTMIIILWLYQKVVTYWRLQLLISLVYIGIGCLRGHGLRIDEIPHNKV